MVERIGAVLKDIGVTDYDFDGIYLYNQYRDSKPLGEFFSAVNQYIGNMLQEFFRDFQSNINLRYNADNVTGQDVVKDSYLYFYLTHYFGIFAGMPYLAKASGYKNVYDAGYIRYDTLDPTSPADNPHNYLYDDEVTNEYGQYTDYNLIAAITSWTLDRSFKVCNMPAIADLLQRIHSSFYKADLDLMTIKFIPTKNYLYVSLPQDPLWTFLQQISLRDLFYLNLPFNGEIQFIIQQLYTMKMPQQVLVYPTEKGTFNKITDFETNLTENNYLIVEYFSDEELTTPKDVNNILTINWENGRIVNIAPDDEDKSAEFPIYCRLSMKNIDIESTTTIITDNFVINYPDLTTITSDEINFEAIN